MLEEAGPEHAAPDAPAAGAGATSLVGAVAELAAAAGEQVGPDDLLRRLVEVAGRHLGVDGVGVMTSGAPAGPDGTGAGRDAVRFLHADHPDVGTVEHAQQVLQEGPCRDAVAARAAVVVHDLDDPAQTAWDAYVPVARRAGFRAVVALPLVSRGRVWGALDLYRRRAEPWREDELAWFHLLAQVAVSYLVMAADRDEARRAQRELARSSTHDALTGLPNRVLLLDRLGHALAVARRHRRTVVVLYIDLDGFKAVNDAFGHAAGDAVLVTTTARLQTLLRGEDTLARLAGDEFVLVCDRLPQGGDGELERAVDAVLARVHGVLARPVDVGGATVVVSASVGIATSEQDSGVDDLLADADAAMYRCKQRTRPDASTEDLSGTRGTSGWWHTQRSLRALERDLAGAAARGELRVHYQPVLAAGAPPGDRLVPGTTGVPAVEALLRWQHPELGLLEAGDFIDLAVRSGTVVPVGQWVLDQVCAQVRRWSEELGPRAPSCAYVNLSVRELRDPSLTATLRAALRAHRLRPAQLGLELLEDSFIDAGLVPVLHELHRLGHPLSVDDFGTGYSSLSRLVELPVQIAKIDRALVDGIVDDPRRRALVRAVVSVATSLDLRVVAEGVETRDQAAHLAAAGCHYLQGNLGGRPQPADVLTAAWRT